MAAAMVGTGPDSDGELRARGDWSRTVGLVLVLPVARPAWLRARTWRPMASRRTSVVSGDAQSWQVQAGVQGKFYISFGIFFLSHLLMFEIHANHLIR